MFKHEIKKLIKEYLDCYDIEYIEDFADDTEMITMVFENYEKCPNRYLEGSIFFYGSYTEAKIYYSKLGSQICCGSKNLSEMYRLLNYINANVFISKSNAYGMVKHNYMSAPRIFLSEDFCLDIAFSLVISNEVSEREYYDALDYLTKEYTKMLNELSAPLFLVVAGKIDVNESIDLIKQHILKENSNRCFS